MNDLYRIIHIYRQFPKHDKFSYSELCKLITPSLNLDQYQIHRVGGEDIGFTNWAYLSDNVEKRFLCTQKLKNNEWNCGNNIWVMQFLAKKNALQIFYWLKDYFKEKIEVDKSVKWLRTNTNHHIYKPLEKYKREFHI
jgi:hemolysin-activating ACP:hemolysin acyltransferase